ncbi:MAG: lipoate--protein ligase family protein [Candidatus Omnitrophota bacterium]
MAFDEALFQQFSAGGSLPTLRIYGWRPAAFSVGYAQDVGGVLRVKDCQENNIPIVRRMTGGGAVFHRDELTYSLVCLKKDIGITGPVVSSFRTLSAFILKAYRKSGLPAEFAFARAPESFKKFNGNTPFCFAGKEKYDILVGGRKIGGNAQKRSGEVIFQHGSIPLTSSIAMAVRFLRDKPQGLVPEICSLEETLPERISFDALALTLKESFQETFCVYLRESGFSSEEQESALRLRREKYSLDAWNIERDFCLTRDTHAYDDKAACQKAALAE